jgi:hypothetical protein
MDMNYTVDYLQAKDYIVSIHHIHDIHHTPSEINYCQEKLHEAFLKDMTSNTQDICTYTQHAAHCKLMIHMVRQLVDFQGIW